MTETRFEVRIDPALGPQFRFKAAGAPIWSPWLDLIEECADCGQALEWQRPEQAGEFAATAACGCGQHILIDNEIGPAVELVRVAVH
jgi:hypothetical protein